MRGSADVRKSEYGAKWNKKWLAKCMEDTTNGVESKNNNAKATAYIIQIHYRRMYKMGYIIQIAYTKMWNEC